MESTENIVDVRSMECQGKFQSVFKAFDSLAPGESFILINQFDPGPLKFKIESLRGSGFSWEYLEESPDICRIRIGKTA